MISSVAAVICPLTFRPPATAVQSQVEGTWTSRDCTPRIEHRLSSPLQYCQCCRFWSVIRIWRRWIGVDRGGEKRTYTDIALAGDIKVFVGLGDSQDNDVFVSRFNSSFCGSFGEWIIFLSFSFSPKLSSSMVVASSLGNQNALLALVVIVVIIIIRLILAVVSHSCSNICTSIPSSLLSWLLLVISISPPISSHTNTDADADYTVTLVEPSPLLLAKLASTAKQIISSSSIFEFDNNNDVVSSFLHRSSNCLHSSSCLFMMYDRFILVVVVVVVVAEGLFVPTLCCSWCYCCHRLRVITMWYSTLDGNALPLLSWSALLLSNYVWLSCLLSASS